MHGQTCLIHMALSIDELRNKVAEMTQQGLNTQQIADELSISQRTVIWLNSGAAEEEHPDDVRIGWRTIGARPNRIDAIGAIMADIVPVSYTHLRAHET